MQKGRRVQTEQLKRITRLLQYTDLPINLIAERFALSRSCIQHINKKYRIRWYGGRHGEFDLWSDASHA